MVLLIDDPPRPTDATAAALLDRARALPGAIQDLLAEPHDRVTAAADAFEVRHAEGEPVTSQEMRELAELYGASVDWLRQLASDQPRVDNSDDFFADHVVGALADDLAVIGSAIEAAADDGALLPLRRVRQLHRRLVSTFAAELTSFERKQYVSLSHAPNKAMNLNSYIGLMGASYREVSTAAGNRARGVRSPRRGCHSARDRLHPHPGCRLGAAARVRGTHPAPDGAERPRRCRCGQTPYSSYPGRRLASNVSPVPRPTCSTWCTRA